MRACASLALLDQAPPASRGRRPASTARAPLRLDPPAVRLRQVAERGADRLATAQLRQLEHALLDGQPIAQLVARRHAPDLGARQPRRLDRAHRAAVQRADLDRHAVPDRVLADVPVLQRRDLVIELAAAAQRWPRQEPAREPHLERDLEQHLLIASPALARGAPVHHEHAQRTGPRPRRRRLAELARDLHAAQLGDAHAQRSAPPRRAPASPRMPGAASGARTAASSSSRPPGETARSPRTAGSPSPCPSPGPAGSAPTCPATPASPAGAARLHPPAARPPRPRPPRRRRPPPPRSPCRRPDRSADPRCDPRAAPGSRSGTCATARDPAPRPRCMAR